MSNTTIYYRKFEAVNSQNELNLQIYRYLMSIAKCSDLRRHASISTVYGFELTAEDIILLTMKYPMYLDFCTTACARYAVVENIPKM